MTLITTNPDSTDVATVSFTSGIDSTYKLYIFKFYDVNPATDAAYFQWQGSIDGGSNYNVTQTTTFFASSHSEDDDPAELQYVAGYDLAQGTGFQYLNDTLEDHADASLVGELHLFNPSNTTYIKHWYATTNAMFQYSPTGAGNVFTAGYFNTTDDIDAVQFKMSSGNMDGVIKMYGVG